MSINFEQDQSHAIEKASDAKDLATQVTKLQELEDLIKAKEQQVKDLKATAENISGEVIPTMMTEMNIKTLKLADGSAVEVKPIYGASIPKDKQ